MKHAQSTPVISDINKPPPRRVHSYNQLVDSEVERLYSSLPFMAIPGLPRKSVAFRREMSQGQLGTAIPYLPSQESLVSDQSELLDELEPKYSANLAMVSMVALLGAFQFGYNTGVINAPKDVIFPDHTDLQWSLVVSMFCIGGLIGAYLAGSIANFFGRKGALLLSSVVFLCSGIVMAFAKTIHILIIGRLVVGISSGASTVFVPLYLGEIAPPALRGALGTCNQFGIVVGILASNILAFPFSNEYLWRYLLGFTSVPALLQLVCAGILVESPRYLIMKGHIVEAETILQSLRDCDDVRIEISSITNASKNETTKQHGLFDILRSPETRFALFLGAGLQMAQQLSGINAVFYYSTSFFSSTQLITNPLIGTTLVGVINVIATGFAIYLMDRLGRRYLLLWSAFGMGVSAFFIVLSLVLKSYCEESGLGLEQISQVANIVALIGVFFFVIFFEIGLGPVPWLITAEIFPANARATAMAVATVCNWACNFIVGLSYPIVQAKLQNYSWIPFLIILVITWICTKLYVIETKEKTLEEIQSEIHFRIMKKSGSSSSQDDFSHVHQPNSTHYGAIPPSSEIEANSIQ